MRTAATLAAQGAGRPLPSGPEASPHLSNLAARRGFEPRNSAPKADVFPVTPPGNVSQTAPDAATTARGQICPQPGTPPLSVNGKSVRGAGRTATTRVEKVEGGLPLPPRGGSPPPGRMPLITFPSFRTGPMIYNARPPRQPRFFPRHPAHMRPLPPPTAFRGHCQPAPAGLKGSIVCISLLYYTSHIGGGGNALPMGRRGMEYGLARANVAGRRMVGPVGLEPTTNGL